MPTNKPTVETTYPLTEHLKDLRKRMTNILICVLIFFGLCYWQSNHIFKFITAPLHQVMEANDSQAQLAMLKLTEGFLTELKMSFLAALFFSMPFITYQMWKFVAPGLYKSERKHLVGFVFSASILFLSGSAFAYYLVFPLGFKFFLSYSGGDWGMVGTLSVAEYLSFVMKLLIAFGLAFELPVVIFFLAKLKIVNTAMLRKYRRFAVVGIFILAALITPPDVISQIMMAIPLLFLYEVSIYITKIVNPDPTTVKKKGKVTEETPDIYS